MRLTLLLSMLSPLLATAYANNTSSACPEFPDQGPLDPSFLTQSLLSITNPAHLSAIESIRHTTALYALAIDTRNFAALRQIFLPSVRANYSDPLGVLQGVESIISTLSSSLSSFASTQHQLGTQLIHVCDTDNAVSVTYFVASHFFEVYTGAQNTIGNDKVLVARAQYRDVWTRGEGGRWVIGKRDLVNMGPLTLDGGFPNATMAR